MQVQNSSTFNFKLFFLRVFLPLILIVSGAGTLFNYFFEQQIIFKYQGGGAYKVNRIIKNTIPDEIPIFGTSRASGSFLPDTLGKNYFNYGIYNTNLNVMLFFLEQECLKKKNTRGLF